jgi:hypothetical protein
MTSYYVIVGLLAGANVAVAAIVIFIARDYEEPNDPAKW